MSTVQPQKDEENEHPVPTEWRPVLASIVSAFVRKDYSLAAGIAGVRPISAETAEPIERYIAEYGETLVELPADTWESSVVQWVGSHWEVLIDLWTKGEGRSDLVLNVRVEELDSAYSYEIHMVYVP